MAKKRKTKAKRRNKPTHCMMVIRVAVPRMLAPGIKVHSVTGQNGPRGGLYMLEVLNAYYDLPKQPTGCM